MSVTDLSTRYPKRITHAELARRSATRSNAELVKRHAEHYVQVVGEELGFDKSGQPRAGACPMCERPFRTDRAFRAMDKAFDRAMGRPEVQVQVMALFEQQLGVRDVTEARGLLNLARSVEGMDETALLETAIAGLRERGYTVLPPANQVAPGGAGISSDAASEPATIPGAPPSAMDGTNGHSAS